MINYLKRSARAVTRVPLNLLLNLLDLPTVVLVYHRVSSLPSDPERLAVTPDNFRDQMRYLKDTFPVVRFEEDWTKAPRPAVAITFDDGYADNVLEALPIIEEVGVPATFFVCTGSIGTTREFWWHELERLLWEGRNLPSAFTLSDNRFGRTWLTDSKVERQEFYNGIIRLMNDIDADLRNNWLDQIRQWSHAEISNDDTHRIMSVDELRLLAASKWVTIGAHTVTHTRLSSLPPNAQRKEIMESKEQIATWLDREIMTFSYPFGRRCDYTKKTVQLCRAAGFTKSAANFPGQAHSWTDSYQIPRHLVRNWPVQEFAARLRGFWTR